MLFPFILYVCFFSMTFVLCKNVDDNCALLVPPPGGECAKSLNWGGVAVEGKGVQVDERFLNS